MSRQKVDELIRELTLLKIREKEIVNLLAKSETLSADIRKGDRIRILNRVKKPKGWDQEWSETAARLATVTRVDSETKAVHFITDNGIATWRKYSNVHKV